MTSNKRRRHTPEQIIRKLAEGENARLKRLLADAELDKDMLREIASGNF